MAAGAADAGDFGGRHHHYGRRMRHSRHRRMMREITMRVMLACAVIMRFSGFSLARHTADADMSATTFRRLHGRLSKKMPMVGALFHYWSLTRRRQFASTLILAATMSGSLHAALMRPKDASPSSIQRFPMTGRRRATPDMPRASADFYYASRQEYSPFSLQLKCRPMLLRQPSAGSLFSSGFRASQMSPAATAAYSRFSRSTVSERRREV